MRHHGMTAARLVAVCAAMLQSTCSLMYNVDDLKGEVCPDQECGPSLAFDGFDCGSCPNEKDFCDEDGQCVDDCEDLECGESHSGTMDCGSCDESNNEECIAGVCHACPEGLSGATCQDCEGGRYDSKTSLCWQNPPSNSNNDYDAYDAYYYCEDLEAGGHTDWFLPDVEMYKDTDTGILDGCESMYGGTYYECSTCAQSASCSALFVTDPEGRTYWTATPASYGVWRVINKEDHVEIAGDSEGTSSMVRCVREMN